MSVVKGLIAISLAFGLVSVLGCSSSSSSDATPPVISNLSHTDNQKVTGSRTISFSVDATDETSLYSVTITHNGTSQTVTNSSANYSASITLEDRTNNVIVVTANDADNSTSQTINLDYPFLAFTDGQSASVVIGQEAFNLVDANRGGNAAINTLSSPTDVMLVDNKLYIADKSNNRVLGFNAVPQSHDANADFVLGWDDFTNTVRGIDAARIVNPNSLASNGTQFYISHNTQAINAWNTLPMGNVDANLIVGQAIFSGTATGCEGNRFGGSVRVFVAGEKLIVSDTINNRVLIWNQLPVSSDTAANLVLGQQDFTHCAPNDGNNDGDSSDPEDGPSASTLFRPTAIWTDGQRLVIGDSFNKRVLIWNTFPIQNFQNADRVLGQANPESNQTPSFNESEFTPGSIASNSNQLFITDDRGISRARIMIWDEWPTEDKQSANHVLGVSSLTLDPNDSNTDQSLVGFGQSGLAIGDTRLIFADSFNNRVLIFEAP